MSIYITREMVSHEPHKGKRKTPGLLGRLTRAVAKTWERTRAMAELNAMSDLELRDMGLYRADIARVVNGTAGRRRGA